MLHPQDAPRHEGARKQGRNQERRVRRGIDVADEDSRAKAKRRLDEALDSPDVKEWFPAAKALFSFSPERPPADEAAPEWASAWSGGGDRPPQTISGVVMLALELGVGDHILAAMREAGYTVVEPGGGEEKKP